ncbi:hypothetical protein [Allosphingosinicella deserti]|uniref:Uncharacterized protein n=1 Tax=Allosphingosinicella deserti TaxID=2116704 RepID=A0A2P7QUI5_9SPHN|nr:hypothetical protein [Sphingomonas deserti]PSJ41627.1 hypothetical protein C7I55_04810 [Sphingomonas deserti]
MPHRLFDWFVRTLMLVLAGLVTLSILGSIAAISTSNGGTSMLAGKRDPGSLPGAPATEGESDPELPRNIGASVGPEAVKEVEAPDPAQASVPRTAPDPRWIEAVAYALLGLAGLVAIGLILVALAVRELRRIADAVERRN